MNMSFITYQQKDCLTGCIVNALRSKGLSCSEADVLLYGGGFLIRYRTITTKDNTKYLIYGELREACFRFLQALNIPYEYIEYGSPEEASAHYAAAKEQGANVIFAVRADCIDYHPIFHQASESQHCLNILQINAEQNTATVSDGYIPSTPVTKYEGEMPLDRLYEGYQNAAFSTVTIYPFAALPDFRRPDEKTMIREILQQYINPPQQDGIFFGKDAVLQLCNDLFLIRDWEKDAFSAKMFDFNTVYKTWGFIGAKRIFAELCAERPYLTQFEAEANEIAEKWNGLSRLIIKIAICGRASMLEGFCSKVRELIQREETLYTSIIAALSDSI